MPSKKVTTGRKRGRPRTNATPVLVRLSPRQLETVDYYNVKYAFCGRAETIRRLIAWADDCSGDVIDDASY